MDFDEYFIRQAYLAASKSKDPRTKIGAVLVRDKNSFVMGYNGFSRKVKDLPERYLDRETKYDFIVHAENNAIYTAARLGFCTIDSILFTQGLPCKGCADALIQSGIIEIVVHKQWEQSGWPHERWEESFEIAKVKLSEADVRIRVFDKFLGLTNLLDNRIVTV